MCRRCVSFQTRPPPFSRPSITPPTCSCRDVMPQRVICLQVIPMLSGDATEQTPPDLPSFLFKERIVYLVRSAACMPP